MANQAGIDRQTAEKLMALFEQFGKQMNTLVNEADPLIHPLPNPIRSELLRALGGMMGQMWELQHPVVRAHPDLDPDGDRFRKPQA
jgi:hypothetical protein